MTGDVYADKPIVERQQLLDQLWQQMGGTAETYAYGHDQEQKQSDEEILSIASKALNGEKFTALFYQGWEQYYSSQSEADFALIDIIAHYTQNRAQIRRMFLASQLGQRDKATRDQRGKSDYLGPMIERSFDRQTSTY